MTEKEVKRRKERKGNTDLFVSALKTTIPVFLGYIPLGMAFGFLLDGAGYHWIYAFLMSLLIYAGAGQFLAVALLAAGAGLTEFVIATLLLNLRHSFYGLSLLEKFSGVGKVKPYLIFALTDETYALLTTTEVPAGGSKSRFYLYIAALDHLYWITGSVLGAVLGSLLDLNLEGMAFVLTALFVVLTIEQYFNSSVRFPFIAAVGAGALSLILFSPDNMLLISIILGTLILMGREKLMQGNISANKGMRKPNAVAAQPVQVQDGSKEEN
ncbi:Branched-chain amino acid transport protein [Methanosarcina horonobensis HB-1 = JCM 15518]|uniref:Branched-chain amino acid transport protein n=1 Tax=Methanosarcina horonobensis HB-1 = JCM 15518 TaxID=1434110 RepID=A0A0E3SA32_9EURY|nr:AzlC family ABC transporter permease [Methanosarcina horonobensis]AKB78509.1 Branched-chain amino acid transport protein [Methanosarcina horonobensis HB-1 = JCM 15518]